MEAKKNESVVDRFQRIRSQAQQAVESRDRAMTALVRNLLSEADDNANDNANGKTNGNANADFRDIMVVVQQNMDPRYSETYRAALNNTRLFRTVWIHCHTVLYNRGASISEIVRRQIEWGWANGPTHRVIRDWSDSPLFDANESVRMFFLPGEEGPESFDEEFDATPIVRYIQWLRQQTIGIQSSTHRWNTPTSKMTTVSTTSTAPGPPKNSNNPNDTKRVISAAPRAPSVICTKMMQKWEPLGRVLQLADLVIGLPVVSGEDLTAALMFGWREMHRENQDRWPDILVRDECKIPIPSIDWFQVGLCISILEMSSMNPSKTDPMHGVAFDMILRVVHRSTRWTTIQHHRFRQVLTEVTANIGARLVPDLLSIVGCYLYPETLARDTRSS